MRTDLHFENEWGFLGVAMAGEQFYTQSQFQRIVCVEPIVMFSKRCEKNGPRPRQGHGVMLRECNFHRRARGFARAGP
jgi:hypothetical protein